MEQASTHAERRTEVDFYAILPGVFGDPDLDQFWSIIMLTARKIGTAIALGTLGLFWAGLAGAVPPASVAGMWSIIGNNHVQTLTLVQGASASSCKPINGTLTNANTNVRGYYCPSTGRIAFARKQLGTNLVNQMWVGNLSEVALNNPLYMAGTFHNVDTAAGGGALLGEFQFQGKKVR